MKPFYLTTSIPYPNANPHIGHALEMVQADFLARYYRLKGRQVYFLTGLDVHGQKIQRTAEKAGLTPEVFIEEKVVVFQDLVKKLGLSNDRYIRTDDVDHMATAQALWKACEANGDIYKKQYKAWYNVKEEEFLGMVDEVGDPSQFGIDPQFLKLIDEENYFFRLSRYQAEIVKILKTKTYRVIPESRCLEVLNFVESKGLQDVSISRDKSQLAWGVPVPGDNNQVMYVWYDALANYLTPVTTIDGQGILQPGEMWPPDLHIVGKDIHRFHDLLWLGMLLSAGIELPKELLVHGFIEMGGEKMSKSIGNTVDPFTILEEYGVDPVRWFLIHNIPTTGDAEFSAERMQEVYLADLANDLGNLVSRIWTMCQKYCGGQVPESEVEAHPELKALVEEAFTTYCEACEKRQLQQALVGVHELIVFCNRRIEEYKPWVLAKDEQKTQELNDLLYGLLEMIRFSTVLLQPVLLESTQKIREQIFPMIAVESWESFAEGACWGVLIPGQKLGEQQVILFPKK